MRMDMPLTDREFDELDRFLLSDRCSDECMTLDALHGFLTALSIGPDMPTIEEWLPHVWGPTPRDAPRFRSPEERQKFVGLIARFAAEIALTFEVAPKEFEPLFSQFEADGQTYIDGEPWAWGFVEGMELRAAVWNEALDSDLEPLLRPILLLGAEDLQPEETALVDTPAKVHRLSLEIEAAVPEIRRYWLAQRKAAEPVRHEAQKPGRNDLCSCGSGKKFKKCCGAH